jgi:hypothetical protein
VPQSLAQILVHLILAAKDRQRILADNLRDEREK